MNKLIIISGPAASGKSTLARRLGAEEDCIEVITQYSTRPSRESDSFDFCGGQTKEQMLECDLRVCKFNNIYGYKFVDIRRVLNNKKYPVVVTSDKESMQALLSEFSDALFIYIQADPSKMIEKMREDNRSEEEISIRLSASCASPKNASYDYIIYNNYDEDFFVTAKKTIEDGRLIDRKTFVVLIQGAVNIGKSTVSQGLYNLLSNSHPLTKIIDVADLRAALRSIPSAFSENDNKILNSQTWQLTYNDFKRQCEICANFVRTVAQATLKEDGANIIFHAVPLDLTLFHQSDFPNQRLVRIFLDIDEKEHIRRIADQDQITELKLKNIDRILEMQRKIKQDTIDDGCIVLQSDVEAPQKIYKMISDLVQIIQ